MTPEAIEKFEKLASLQRGAPESVMLKASHFMGGGVLSHAIEHVGDINHRMNEGLEYYNPSHGWGNVMKKAKDFHYLRDRGWMSFQAEHDQNMSNNYDYWKEQNPEKFKKYPTYESFLTEVARRLNVYADEHAKLPVYNEMQYAARSAAIALGRQKFKEASDWLQKILAYDKDRDGWVEAASQYDPDFELVVKGNPMKKLPKYLDDMFAIIAREESIATGENPAKVAERYKQEFIDDSLTAKANPSPTKENPRRGKGHGPEEFDPDQLARGTAHEMEHTDDPKEAQLIAIDHLVEDPDYYRKLEKMEAGKCEETWVDDIDGEENPRIHATKELQELFFNTKRGNKGYNDFGNSTLGQALNDEEKQKFWDETERLVARFVNPMLIRVMGLKMDAKGGNAALQYPADMDIKLKRKLGPDIEKRRYMKLYFSIYLTSMIMKFFDTHAGQVNEFLRQLEGGKEWDQLRKRTNRKAFAKAMKAGMDSLLKDTTAGYLAGWAQGNKPLIKKLNDEAAAEQAIIEKKLGTIGKAALERLKRPGTLPAPKETPQIESREISNKVMNKFLAGVAKMMEMITLTPEDVQRYQDQEAKTMLKRSREVLTEMATEHFIHYVQKENMDEVDAANRVYEKLKKAVDADTKMKAKKEFFLDRADVIKKEFDEKIAPERGHVSVGKIIGDFMTRLKSIVDDETVIKNKITHDELWARVQALKKRFEDKGVDYTKNNESDQRNLIFASAMGIVKEGIVTEEEAMEIINKLLARLTDKSTMH